MQENVRIIHIDMDAFFAAVEMRDFPQYRGKPLIVGGPPNSRGVVSTCSYEARRYGIHSAMPSYLAFKLCPKAIFVSGRYDIYSKIGRELKQIFLEFTPLVESVSIDEAYLDVSEQTRDIEAAAKLAGKIKERIKQSLRLTASAGVSFNKFLAKIASEMHKPDGLTVISPETALTILEELDIRKFHGIGKATAERMHNLGIRTGRDLKKVPLAELIKHFGKAGSYYHSIVRGIDRRKVTVSRTRRSLGKERTFARDLYSLTEMEAVLRKIAHDVSAILTEKGIKGKTVTLKLKYNDFTLQTRCLSKPYYFNDEKTLFQTATALLACNYRHNRGIRLLGISLSNLDTEEKAEREEQQEFGFFRDYGNKGYSD
jgi:DNA polymerase-4